MLADDKTYWEQRIAALKAVTQETLDMVDLNELYKEINIFKSKSLNGVLPELKQTMLAALDHEVSVLKASAQALEDLKKFSSASLNFFLNGFYKSPRRLKRSSQYPAPAVLHTLLTEISVDLEIFQRSLQQRRLVGDKVSKHLFILSVGDRVAAAALQPAFEANYLKKVAVTTHLGDDFNIRLVPYSQMLLIEMPFTTGSVLSEKAIQPVPNHEHLALLHEVGHHVYHQGIVPNTHLTFEKYLVQELFQQGITGGLANWLEELFADVYGLLVGGPVMVVSYQERLSQETPEALSEDTGDHPISILRPLIQTQVLRLITSGGDANMNIYRNAPEILDRNWYQFLHGKDPKSEVYSPQGVSQPVSGDVIVGGLVPIIQKILAALGSLRTYAATEAWSKDLEPGQSLDVLSDQLQKSKFLLKVAAQEFGEDGEASSLVETYKKMAGHNLPEDEWLSLFSFVGWSTAFSVGDMPSRSVGIFKVGDMPSR